MMTAKLVPTTLLFLRKVSDAKLEAGGQSQFSSSVQLAVKGLIWDVLWTITLRIKFLHIIVKVAGKHNLLMNSKSIVQLTVSLILL